MKKKILAIFQTLMKMTKEEKADKLLEEGKIFKLYETEKYSYYLCKGSNSKIYKQYYNKADKTISCDCKNIRLVPCYHMVACRQLEEGTNND